jgi:hypothetical protein
LNIMIPLPVLHIVRVSFVSLCLLWVGVFYDPVPHLGVGVD